MFAIFAIFANFDTCTDSRLAPAAAPYRLGRIVAEESRGERMMTNDRGRGSMMVRSPALKRH
jgi:hypothetical protein